VPAAPTTSRRAELEQALASDGDRLYRLALRVTRDPDLAADALHDAFASALQAVDGFQGASTLSTWLYRIVYNSSIDLLRRKRREQPLAEPEGELAEAELLEAHASGPLPEQALLAAEAGRALERALGELTPLQRAVFELREQEGLSSEEAGERLGLQPGAVRVHLHRARLRLRARLSELLGGAP
jgi:RNA polymerase sigma-70 factor (ECF subfamily)